MPRKKQYQWDVETNGQEAPEQLSRSAKKRQSTALQDLGAELTKLNVAMGGTLWQDVPSQYRTAEGKKGVAHSQTRSDFYTSHGALIEEDTKLYALLGRREIRVNSFHHQAVREPAPCMKVAAHASDGLIEAIEHPDLPFFMGVQWHPERYFDRDETAMALFSALCDAAREFQNRQ